MSHAAQRTSPGRMGQHHQQDRESVKMRKVRTEALAYRIYIYSRDLEWDVTLAELSEVMDEPIQRINKILQLKGWGTRIRHVRNYTTPAAHVHDTLKSIPRRDDYDS